MSSYSIDNKEVDYTDSIKIDYSYSSNSMLDTSATSIKYRTPKLQNAIEYFKKALNKTMFKKTTPENFEFINKNLKQNINVNKSTINLEKDNNYKKFNIYYDQNVYDIFHDIPNDIYDGEEDYQTSKKKLLGAKTICQIDLNEAIYSGGITETENLKRINRIMSNKIEPNLDLSSYKSNGNTESPSTDKDGRIESYSYEFEKYYW